MSEVDPGALSPGADFTALLDSIESLRRQVAILGELQPRKIPVPVLGATAFMVMPFGPEDLQIVYDDFVKPTLEKKCGLVCLRGDDMHGSNVIIEDVLAAIQSASLVIADLTGQNANVFYEVGVAHALRKPVLLMSQSLDDVPFDLRHRRVLIYDYTPHGCKILENNLETHIRQMINDLAPTPV